jgi:hypothetical protein
MAGIVPIESGNDKALFERALETPYDRKYLQEYVSHKA